MNRKEFISNSCRLCLGATLLGAMAESCAPVKYTSGILNENGMLVKLNEFHSAKGNRSYIIVSHDSLRYPICVYKIDANNYSALYMQCSHQGAELQVSGDRLTCPAHGSEFDKWGRVQQSPAVAQLRTFPVTLSGDQLFIDLRKQS